ncbi:MAG TPA: hypothetical protein VH989_13045 [Actinomycetota bacterium]
MRRGLFLALVALVFVAGVVAIRFGGDDTQGSASCERGWVTVRPPRGDIVPRSADVAGGSGWIVGMSFVGGHGRTFSARPEGAGWAAVDTPNAGPSYNVLEDVSIVSADEAWAVGASFDRRKIGRALTERWNGTAWEVVALPDTGLGDASLLGVAADASGAWAVGSAATRDGERPLILRWDGDAWAEVRAERAGPNTELNDVALAGDGGAWAVGATVHESGARSPLVERWDGERWSLVPIAAESGYLSAITVAGPDQGWAVGAAFGPAGIRPLALRWNGTVWSPAPIEYPGASSAFVAVDASEPDDAWAVGWVGDEDRRPLVEHWDGSAWQIVDPPESATLTTVVVGDGAVWIAGRRSTPEGLEPPLLARRCGSGDG